jgi:hypothetical protein
VLYSQHRTARRPPVQRAVWSSQISFPYLKCEPLMNSRSVPFQARNSSCNISRPENRHDLSEFTTVRCDDGLQSLRHSGCPGQRGGGSWEPLAVILALLRIPHLGPPDGFEQLGSLLIERGSTGSISSHSSGKLLSVSMGLSHQRVRLVGLGSSPFGGTDKCDHFG